METFEGQLRKIQRRHWQTWILMLTLFLILATFIVLVVFYSDLQKLYEEQVDVYMFNFLLVGFVALSLLFVGYAVLKEMALKELQKDLIARTIAFKVMEQRLKYFRTIFEVATLVNSEIALSGVLDTISSKALEALGGEQSSLFLYDPQTGKLRCVSVWGPQSHVVKNKVVDVGESVAGWVMKHGKPLHLGEDFNEAQFPGFIKKEKKIASSLCLPLMVKNKAKGVLNINLFDKNKKFTESDVSLVSIFAANAAMAIEKAELYDELRMQTETLKETIVELKATQDRCIRPETLSALSNLVTGVAHEFDKTSTNILEKTKLLLREIVGASIPANTEENALEWLRRVEQLATNGAETAQHVLAFARSFQSGAEKDSGKLDINAIVREAVEATLRKKKDNAESKASRAEMGTKR